jgi:two-component system alkaline phosphatase synthesis response regulator PhoP
MAEKGDTILIVDDDQMIVQILTIILEGEGYDVLEAEDGMEAVRILDKTAKEIKVILLDQEMPGILGTAISRMVKRQDRFKNIQIILQTALKEDEDVIYGMEAGADKYLAKPYEDDVVVAMVKACIRDYDWLQSTTNQLKKLKNRVKILNEFLLILEDQILDPSPFSLLSRLRVHMRELMKIPGDPEIRLSTEDDSAGVHENQGQLKICIPPFAVVLDDSISEEQQGNVIQMLSIMSKHIQIKTQEAANLRLHQQLKSTIDTVGHGTLELVKEIDEAGDEMSKEQLLQKMKLNILEMLVAAGHEQLREDLDRLKMGAMSGEIKSQDQESVDDLLSQFGL